MCAASAMTSAVIQGLRLLKLFHNFSRLSSELAFLRFVLHFLLVFWFYFSVKIPKKCNSMDLQHVPSAKRFWFFSPSFAILFVRLAWDFFAEQRILNLWTIYNRIYEKMRFNFVSVLNADFRCESDHLSFASS